MDSHYSSVNPKTEVPISTYSVDLYSPHVCPYFPYDTSWENLPKNQDMFSLMAVSFILITSRVRVMWVTIWYFTMNYLPYV